MTASLKSFLDNDILGNAAAQMKERDGLNRFSKYLPNDVSPLWQRLLSRFVRYTPWRYWDPYLVEICLSVLELDIHRTSDAIEERSTKLGLGIENLLRRSCLADYEERLALENPRDLIKIAIEYHPEYLRYAEHIFSNLLEIYWSILKKKSVKGDYDLRGAAARLQSTGYGNLLSGYVDDIRNAVAHGDVFFDGFGIRYGLKHENSSNEFTASEFLSEFDQLHCTSNALAIGIFLFFARNFKHLAATKALNIPTSIIALLAAAGIERPGLEIIGTVESENCRVGRQLHIAIKSYFKARTIIMADALRLSAYLIQNGASNYNRFLIQIDNGEAANSLLIILPEKLKILLDEDATIDRINEAFDKTQLLWFDERNISRRIKTLKLLFSTYAKLTVDDIHRRWAQLGIRSWASRYRIRHIKNIGTSGMPRMEIRAVLLHPEDSENKDLVRKIIREIVKKAPGMRINRAPGVLNKNISWLAHPKIIGVYLHKLDGTVRHLEQSGWFSGNLVAIGEKVKGFRNKAIFVPNPEEICEDIRLRYKSELPEL